MPILILISTRGVSKNVILRKFSLNYLKQKIAINVPMVYRELQYANYCQLSKKFEHSVQNFKTTLQLSYYYVWNAKRFHLLCQLSF